MLGLLIVTHGRFAEELVAAARHIVGSVDAIRAVSIDWDADVEQALEAVQSAVEQLDRGRGVLILTDMFGGTPTNLALRLIEPDRVDVVTGVNLPMLIKFTNHRDEYSLADAAKALAAQGRQAIHAASDLLEGESADDGEAAS